VASHGMNGDAINRDSMFGILNGLGQGNEVGDSRSAMVMVANFSYGGWVVGNCSK
jgi:hypothetical protein